VVYYTHYRYKVEDTTHIEALYPAIRPVWLLKLSTITPSVITPLFPLLATATVVDP
jgi:hypothetical protein